jgi:hypothetical protein
VTWNVPLAVLLGGLLAQGTGSTAPWWWTLGFPLVVWLVAVGVVLFVQAGLRPRRPAAPELPERTPHDLVMERLSPEVRAALQAPLPPSTPKPGGVDYTKRPRS